MGCLYSTLWSSACTYFCVSWSASWTEIASSRVYIVFFPVVLLESLEIKSWLMDHVRSCWLLHVCAVLASFGISPHTWCSCVWVFWGLLGAQFFVLHSPFQFDVGTAFYFLVLLLDLLALYPAATICTHMRTCAFSSDFSCNWYCSSCILSV